MGIYIKSMEMPTSCGFCLFEKYTDDGYECCINRCLTEYQKRPNDCPLTHIPPHGRLIDADALYKDMAEDYYTPRTLSHIDHAQTIIPAKESDC